MRKQDGERKITLTEERKRKRESLFPVKEKGVRSIFNLEYTTPAVLHWSSTFFISREYCPHSRDRQINKI